MKLCHIRAVFFRYLYPSWRGPYMFADLFYWPLVDILLWGLTSVWIQHHQGSAAHIPLILMTALVFWQITVRGANDIAANLLQEFWTRNLVNLFSTSLKLVEWSAGVILLCLCKLMVTIFFGALAVYVLYALNIFSVGAAFLPFAASLLIFGWALGFLAAGLIIYWGHQVEVIAWAIAFIFAPFSAVFYPVAVLPEWAQSVSWCLPTTYIFEGMREILISGSLAPHYFWVSMALNGIYLIIAYVFFKWMFIKSLAKGLGRLA